jgi:hypothetical protein
LKDLGQTMQSYPVIIFTENDPTAFFNLIKKECHQSGLVYELVLTDENAKKLRKNAGDRLRGVFVMSTQYCRGYDMKLGEDARVMIFAGDKGFPLS